jgi:hypothetical protein
MKRLLVRVGLGVIFLLAGGCGGPPQIGPDEEAFKAVDALYTAVTSRRPQLLDQCDRQLQDLQKQGKLPEPAHEALQKIIAKARDGEWEPAALDLSKFMKGQRRPQNTEESRGQRRSKQ